MLELSDTLACGDLAVALGGGLVSGDARVVIDAALDALALVGVRGGWEDEMPRPGTFVSATGMPLSDLPIA